MELRTFDLTGCRQAELVHGIRYDNARPHQQTMVWNP